MAAGLTSGHSLVQIKHTLRGLRAKNAAVTLLSGLFRKLRIHLFFCFEGYLTTPLNRKSIQYRAGGTKEVTSAIFLLVNERQCSDWPANPATQWELKTLDTL